VIGRTQHTDSPIYKEHFMTFPLSTSYSPLSLGLIGYPLGHSLSPQIHGAALHALGISGEYGLFPIPPLPEGHAELALLLDRVRHGEIHGLNVTIPHKQNMMPLLDELTPAAQAIGAVNTIFLQDQKLIGDNTDAPGFWADLQQLAAAFPQHPSALILGAGGSACAVAYALLTHGWHVNLLARRVEQAQKLGKKLAVFSNQLSVIASDYRSLSTDHYTLLVNTTPVGMHPNIGVSPWPKNLPFPENAAVYDLVYNPRETLLVRQARAAGLPAITGLGMLVEQAALAFERWTGLGAPRKAMQEAVKM
jgi:shikimate dehydrogenase